MIFGLGLFALLQVLLIWIVRQDNPLDGLLTKGALSFVLGITVFASLFVLPGALAGIYETNNAGVYTRILIGSFLICLLSSALGWVWRLASK